MDKVEMRREYWKSPDDADALMMTFWDNPQIIRKQKEERERQQINPFTGELKRSKHLSHKLTTAW